MDTNTEHWLRLVHAPGVGRARQRRLLAHYGTIDAITRAPAAELRQFGLGDEGVAILRGDRRPDAIAAELAWAQTLGCHLLAPTDAHWPERLTALHDPPPLLYVRGDPEVLRQPALAIVGSRNPSPAGRETAHEFARHLARAGLVVVSGLALGIDAAAHEGALAAGGLTVAVAGTGLDRVYPARHADLARRIAAEGALLSELPLGTRPARRTFPQRNRIVTGLCLGTLIVEAGAQSGSLISARHAMEQGREVFAIPGSIHNPLARGCHRLIRQGAKLVETASDILEELGPQIEPSPPPHVAPSPSQAVSTNTTAATEAAAADDPEYQRIMAALDWEPRGPDDLAERSGLEPGAVASMVLRLELEGVIRVVPGGLYQRR